MEIARLAYKLNPTQAWNGFVCGMAEYRHQNHKEAVQLLIEAISTSNDRNCLRLSYLYHAMACWELGQFDEAKASFKKGKDLCDLIVKNVDRPFQHDKVYALLALEEAEVLMGLK